MRAIHLRLGDSGGMVAVPLSEGGFRMIRELLEVGTIAAGHGTWQPYGNRGACTGCARHRGGEMVSGCLNCQAAHVAMPRHSGRRGWLLESSAAIGYMAPTVLVGNAAVRQHIAVFEGSVVTIVFALTGVHRLQYLLVAC